MNKIWDGRQVVVTVGTGGVGKTTVSASIAIAASAAGLRTLVMTIDPAKRLASALGLSDTHDEVYELDTERLRATGIELKAPLFAMIPNVKSTFDQLIDRFASDPERPRSLLSNPIYRHFSTGLAGALEYAAVERLYQMHRSGAYDLIVLDTPPAQNVLEFLDAPNRIVDFLELDTIQWLLKTNGAVGRLGAKLFEFGGAKVFNALGRLAGTDTLHALAEFILGFQGMYDGFRERAASVKALLSSDDVGYVLVGSTSQSQRESMLRFRSELTTWGLEVDSAVLNRVYTSNLSSPWPSDWQQALGTLGVGSDALRAADAERRLADRDAEAIVFLRAELGIPVITLPELRTDVHDLHTLSALYSYFS